MQETTSTEKSGRSRSGKARWAGKSKEERSAFASAAAKARWDKKKSEPAPEIPPVVVANVVQEPATPAPLGGRKRSAGPRAKPRPKEFGKAHSYAEKRLADAMKERAECMNKLAMLDAEIPSLVQIIRALGSTNGTYQIQPTMPYYPAAQQMPQMQVPAQVPLVPEIDPALFQTNAGPLPGLQGVPSPQHPLIPKMSGGGAMDLDYHPVTDEGPPLPNLGGGWQ